MRADRQAEARTLAEDLLADIEFTRLGAEQVLLKAFRLARLINDEVNLRWLEMELNGYTFTKETREILARMNRLTNDKEGEGAYTSSLGAIEATIRAQEARLDSLKTPSLSSQSLVPALHNLHGQINSATSSIVLHTRIRSAVLAQIYSFTTNAYHELTFSEKQGALFEAARREIDGSLVSIGATALGKIESIAERLENGDQEAISQAMSTCRRLIDSFADAVFPPQPDPVLTDGQPMEVNRSKVLNRIDAFVEQYAGSKSRRQRLRQVLRGIYERVSAGVHDDVTPTEARFLFLETYVVLGEILSLAPRSDSAAN